jgi:hypothetical protein
VESMRSRCFCDAHCIRKRKTPLGQDVHKWVHSVGMMECCKGFSKAMKKSNAHSTPHPNREPPCHRMCPYNDRSLALRSMPIPSNSEGNYLAVCRPCWEKLASGSFMACVPIEVR